MGQVLTNRGKSTIGRLAFGFNSEPKIQTLSVDGSNVGFAAGDVALNSGGPVANEFDVAFVGDPTEGAGQVFTFEALIPAASALFLIKRWAIHNATPANVSTSSQTLIAGVDGLTIDHSAGNFALRVKGTLAIP